MQKSRTNQKNKNEKLILACQNSNYIQVKQLLEHGANPNTKNENATCLHYCKDYDILKLLLEHGADPNGKDCNGHTKIIDCRDVKLLRLLLDHGADYNAFDYEGHVTVFGFSIWTYNYKCCKLLIKRGYNVNKKSYYETYLFDALYVLQSEEITEKNIKNIIKIIKLLLKHVNKTTLKYKSKKNDGKTFMEAIKPNYLVLLSSETIVNEDDSNYKFN
jgi:ankyrin repeat protein